MRGGSKRRNIHSTTTENGKDVADEVKEKIEITPVRNVLDVLEATGIMKAVEKQA